MKYAAFLRAVNVGGRTVKMAELKACLEKAGLKNVRTFIASGNVLFEDQRSPKQLADLIEKTLEKQFGFAVGVLVMDAETLGKLVKKIPANWVNDKEMKCDVMFLWPELDNPAVLEQLPYNPKIEDVKYLPGAVLWQIDRDKATKSRMFKIVGTKLYKQMTVRNPNTVRKIYALLIAE
jgi:uncharacterized protein (DUF1697 family)